MFLVSALRVVGLVLSLSYATKCLVLCLCWSTGFGVFLLGVVLVNFWLIFLVTVDRRVVVTRVRIHVRAHVIRFLWVCTGYPWFLRVVWCRVASGR